MFTISRKGQYMAVKVRQRNGKWWVFIDHKGKRKAKGVGEMSPRVFVSGAGTPINRGHFRWRTWWALLAKAGLRYVRIHDLLHTYASLLIQQGKSLAYVKEQMGHHSIQVTVDTYGHLRP